MRRLTPFLLLLPLVGALDVQPIDITFEAPLVAEADVDTGPWQWLVLYIGPQDEGNARGAAANTVDVTTFSRESTRYEAENVTKHRSTVQETQEHSMFASGGIQASSTTGWKSIILHGTNITATAWGAAAVLDLRGPEDPLLEVGTRRPHPTAHRDGSLTAPTTGTWMRLDPLNTATGFDVRITATGVESIEWHGWGLSCSGDCGNARTDSTEIGQAPLTTRYDTHRYVRWAGDLTLTVDASAWLVAAGSTEPVTFGHAGVLRLPSASSDAFNHTGAALRLDGSGKLSGLHVSNPAEPQLTATLQGTYNGIQFGENPVLLPSNTARTAAVAAAVLLPFLLRWLWLLWARHDRISEAQQEIADALKIAPGASYRDLMRITGSSNGALDWNLHILERRRLVASREYKNTKRFFWGAVPQGWKQHVVAAREDLQPLLQWAQSRDTFMQADAAVALEASRSTAQRWLADLVDAGMLHTYKDGRRRIYQYFPHVQEMVPATVVAAE